MLDGERENEVDARRLLERIITLEFISEMFAWLFGGVWSFTRAADRSTSRVFDPEKRNRWYLRRSWMGFRGLWWWVIRSFQRSAIDIGWLWGSLSDGKLILIVCWTVVVC